MADPDLLPAPDPVEQGSPVEQAARRLLDAAHRRTPCHPVRDLIAPDDVDAAYAVQSWLATHRRRNGGRPVGRKIGLTSPAVQRQLGVDRPDFGVLFADMRRDQQTPIDMSELLQPRIEAEIAFALRADLADGPLDDAQVRAAVGTVRAALEIVDSRIDGWDISFADTVADNGSSGLFVLGDVAGDLAHIEPRDVSMTMTVDGEQVSSGTGSACLGDPLAALRWLAATAARLGDPLRAGDVVLSGALGPMVPVRPETVVRAEITGLGAVTARFGPAR